VKAPSALAAVSWIPRSGNAAGVVIDTISSCASNAPAGISIESRWPNPPLPFTVAIPPHGIPTPNEPSRIESDPVNGGDAARAAGAPATSPANTSPPTRPRQHREMLLGIGTGEIGVLRVGGSGDVTKCLQARTLVGRKPPRASSGRAEVRRASIHAFGSRATSGFSATTLHGSPGSVCGS
jgi:hypothetical protein